MASLCFRAASWPAGRPAPPSYCRLRQRDRQAKPTATGRVCPRAPAEDGRVRPLARASWGPQGPGGETGWMRRGVGEREFGSPRAGPTESSRAIRRRGATARETDEGQGTWESPAVGRAGSGVRVSDASFDPSILSPARYRRTNGMTRTRRRRTSAPARRAQPPALAHDHHAGLGKVAANGVDWRAVGRARPASARGSPAVPAERRSTSRPGSRPDRQVRWRTAVAVRASAPGSVSTTPSGGRTPAPPAPAQHSDAGPSSANRKEFQARRRSRPPAGAQRVRLQPLGRFPDAVDPVQPDTSTSGNRAWAAARWLADAGERGEHPRADCRSSLAVRSLQGLPHQPRALLP